MWDQRFEQLLRHHLPFLPTDQRLAGDLILRDVGLDSLGVVELLDSLESAYDVRFVDDVLRAETFETPEGLWCALSATRAVN